MEAATKRTRSGYGSAEPDRLSALPDGLLRHILSFLRSRQAVQTTVLSKRWVDLWRKVPAINLDQTEFPPYRERLLGNWEKMKDFATDLLMLHSAEGLDLFRLSFRYTHANMDPDVQRWIRRALKHHPLVLDISVVPYAVLYPFPRLFSGFCRLKTLHLHGLSLNGSFEEHLRSGCPVLEDLNLDLCDLYFCCIQSDTLKNLVVSYCTNQLLVKSTLAIKAPAISSLCLKFQTHTDVSLDAGNSLERASISVPPDYPSQKVEVDLLGSLFNVTSLELEGFNIMGMLEQGFDELPIFVNLKILSLNWFCHVQIIKALGRFLQKYPNLEKFTLQNIRDTFKRTDQQLCTGRLQIMVPFVDPIKFPTLSNLTNLILDKCDLHDNFKLLRHFLRSAPNLRNLTVRCCKLPEGSVGRKGNAKSKNTFSQVCNMVNFQLEKLKSTEIIYRADRYDGDIGELVNLLLNISSSSPENNIKLTKLPMY